MIQEALEALVARPEGAGPGAPPGLRDAVPGLKSVDLWEGPWDALASPERVSIQTPAAFVSLIDLAVVGIGRTVEGRGSLTPTGAATVPPVRRSAESRPRPTCLIEVAVTLFEAGGDADERAAALVGLAEQALVVMVDHALEHIEGSNLSNDKLRAKGLSTFMLSGFREIEIEPADPERELPSRVDVVRQLSVRTVYPRPEC